MYNIDRINTMIEDIKKFFADLDTINPNENNIENPEILHSTSMLIFGIMNRSIDIAQEIIVKNEIGMPQKYGESFSILGDKGIIDKKLIVDIEKLIEKRGLFAHHYYDVNKKEVIKLSKDINIVKKFVESVKKLIERDMKNKNDRNKQIG